MKRFIILLLTALLLVSCGERAYRTKVDGWTKRISLASYQTLAHNNAGAIMEAWQLQIEINDTIPPASYKKTHQHLKTAIDYYVIALDANNTHQPERALYYLSMFQQEMRLAQQTL